PSCGSLPAKPTMFVRPDCFNNVSPAELLSSLGHETIHYLQNLRDNPGKNPKDMPAFAQLAIQDMRELEAWTWEYGGDVPHYGFEYRKDPAADCLADQEKAEIKFQVDT